MRPTFGLIFCLLCVGLRAPSPLSAQTSVLRPAHEGYFPSPRGAPREARFGFGAISTDVFNIENRGFERPGFFLPQSDEELARELQATVEMGINVPFWKPVEWDDGGVSVGIQTGVFARFRLEISSNDLVSSDWLIHFPVEFKRGPVSARFRIGHWSAHIGDELMEQGAERIDFTYETAELLGAYEFEHFRVYGGGSKTLRSSLENDPKPSGELVTDNGHVQAGLDGSWYPWDDGRMGLHGGLDWQINSRSEWEPRYSFLGGLTMLRGGREVRVDLQWFDGPSPMGQFYLTLERYFGAEVQLYF